MLKQLRTAVGSVMACLLAATGSPSAAAPVLFSVTDALQTFDVTLPGDYRIVAAGAAGGTVQNGALSGLGARAEAIFTFSGTEQLQIIVGNQPGLISSTQAAGGGGGSFVYLPAQIGNLISLPIALVVGGGGGGAAGCTSGAGGNASLGPSGTAGLACFGGSGGNGGAAGLGGDGGYASTGTGTGAGGGGGFFTSGGGGLGGLLRGGEAAILGADGGGGTQDGGFGGGGGSVFFAGGGGGGYGGGGGGGSDTGGGGGGGGGSFVNEFFAGYVADSAAFSLLSARTDGFVIIEYLGRGGGTVPLPGTLALTGLAGLLLLATRRRRGEL